MKKLIIDRTKWYRGETSEYSRLLRIEDQTMCCLGFYSLACGLKPENILGLAFPSGVEAASPEHDHHDPAELPKEMLWLPQYMPVDTEADEAEEVERVIGEVNDDEDLSEAEREAKLTKLFAAHDVAVEFIN